MADIRDAVFDDYEELLILARKIHKGSQLSHIPMDENSIRRVFTRLITFGFSKVVIENGKIIGCMFAFVHPNQFGARIAYDQLTYPGNQIRTLFKQYYTWAKEQQADIVTISNFSGSEKYNRLIQKLGFNEQSYNFSRS